MLPGSPWKGSNAVHALPGSPGVVKHWVIGDVIVNRAMASQGYKPQVRLPCAEVKFILAFFGVATVLSHGECQDAPEVLRH